MSFRGRKINRVAREGREGTYNTIRKRQEECLDLTRSLVRVMLDSIRKCDHYTDHKQDLNLFFESKDLLDTAAKYLSEEKEEQSL